MYNCKVLKVIVGALLWLSFSFCRAEFTKSQWSQILEISRTCFKQLDIPKDSDMVQRIFFHQNLTYNEQESKYILCYHREAGWLDTQDIYHSERVVDFFTQNQSLDRNKMEELIDGCLAKDSVLDKMVDRAVKFYQCFWANKKFEL